MIIETWGKVWCPQCKAPNWFCQGDLTDLTVCDVLGIACWSCNHTFSLDGNILGEEIDFVPGKKEPR
jgi:hypothetical protein